MLALSTRNTRRANHAKQRSSVRRLGFAGAAVLGAGTLVVLGATAYAGDEGGGTTPPMLEANELPPAASDWTAGETTSGTGRERFCLPEELPQDGTHHREFRTELETSASQLVFQADDEDAAEQLVERLNTSIENCATTFEQDNPDGKAEYKDFGGIPVADGGWVHGVGTERPQSSRDVNLLGVGLNGDKVTVVNWREYGTLDDVTSHDFTKTVETAMVKFD